MLKNKAPRDISGGIFITNSRREKRLLLELFEYVVNGPRQAIRQLESLKVCTPQRLDSKDKVIF